MHIILPFIVLVFTYLVLSANDEPANMLLGTAIAVGILVALRPKRYRVNWRQVPASLLAVLRYTLRLLFNMFKSGLQMARIILDPKLPLKSGIVAIPSGCASEVSRALSAHAISLPPGELFIEMDRTGTMFIHTLDVETTLRRAGPSQEMQRELLKRIFE